MIITGTPIGHHGKLTIIKTESGKIVEVDAMLYMINKREDGVCEYDVPDGMIKAQRGSDGAI